MSKKIYTKTGDKGETSLFGGARLSKDNIRIEAYGTIDELNATIGYLYEVVPAKDVREVLFVVQNKLFNIGSVLAVDPTKDFELPGVNEDDVTLLEREIDRMQATLPELKQFVLPSGHRNGASAHISRTVCRRAERRIVSLSARSDVDDLILTYLNRLSDYLFTLARYLVYQNGSEEVKWDPNV
jgi:cob(I)alamin adenosyltransferase